MKAILSTVLVLVATAALAGIPRAGGPDLLAEPMVDLAGEPASLNDFKGDVLVVNFWASWCPPCRDELPELDAWNTEWSGKGARVVAVSIDRRAANAERFVAEAGLDLPVLVDGPDGLAAALDLAAVPSTFLLDRDGRIVMTVHGFDRQELGRLKLRAEELMQERKEGRSA
jgi:thiol-disulfide isomerase/thioredoxin